MAESAVLTGHVAGPVEEEMLTDGLVVPTVRCLCCDFLIWTAAMESDAPALGFRVALPTSCPGVVHDDDV